jgi:hypothetical protein
MRVSVAATVAALMGSSCGGLMRDGHGSVAPFATMGLLRTAHIALEDYKSQCDRYPSRLAAIVGAVEGCVYESHIDSGLVELLNRLANGEAVSSYRWSYQSCPLESRSCTSYRIEAVHTAPESADVDRRLMVLTPDGISWRERAWYGLMRTKGYEW